MIKLPIQNLKMASRNYVEKMLPLIGKRINSTSLDGTKDAIVDDLITIIYFSDNTNEFLRDLLSKHITCVKRKYPVVRSYMNLCDKYVATEDMVLKKRIDIINEEIKKIISYDFMTPTIRIKLHNDMGIRICPYCNRQYINPMMKISGREVCLGTLDHILPKNIYQLLSLSVYNLVPSCSGCNSTLKGTSKLKILNPWISGFDDDVIYTVKVESITNLLEKKQICGEWTKQTNISKKKGNLVDNNKNVFSLDEMYESNSTEIRNILLKKCTLQSCFYKKAVGEYIQIEDAKLLYNVSLDKSKFHEEFMSKLIYDLVKYNYIPVK